MTREPLARLLGCDEAALLGCFRETDDDLAVESCGNGGGMTDERGDDCWAMAATALGAAWRLRRFCCLLMVTTTMMTCKSSQFRTRSKL